MYSQHFKTAALYVAALLVPLVGVGCGGSSGKGAAKRLETYPVTGKVTLNGAPVPGASVTFSPAESGKPAAIGRTDSQGKYTLTTYEADDGAVEGEFTVLVTKTASDTGEAPPASPRDNPNYGQPPMSYEEMQKEQQEEGSGSTLPAKYKSRKKSPLTATVTPDGENKFNFDLKP